MVRKYDIERRKRALARGRELAGTGHKTPLAEVKRAVAAPDDRHDGQD